MIQKILGTTAAVTTEHETSRKIWIVLYRRFYLLLPDSSVISGASPEFSEFRVSGTPVRCRKGHGAITERKETDGKACPV
jgi:hypothetical protein